MKDVKISLTVHYSITNYLINLIITLENLLPYSTWVDV